MPRSPGDDGAVTIAAFDVFDTVITRAVGSPRSVFLLLGKRLLAGGLVSCSAEEFARSRIQAEGRAHNNRGGISCTLEEIYAELCLASNTLNAAPSQLMAAECQLESELLRAVPETIARISSERGQGRGIVFISDMYLSKAFIFEQLASRQAARDGDGCYVSSEQRKWKRNGGLFRDVLEKERVSGRELSYLGNDINVDICPARSVNIKAEHFKDGNLNRHEETLESYSLATGGLSSALAGASRLARLNVAAGSAKEESLRDFSASVIAPTLVSYTIWLLHYARRHNLTRLYFLSRDGEILLKIAGRIAHKLNVKCELRYLYGSRRAWGIASVVKGDFEELAWLLDRDPGPCLNRLLARLGIPAREIAGGLETMGFKESRWDENFLPDDLATIKSGRFLDLIRPHVVRNAGRQRNLLFEYLEREGVLADSRYGLVDVGWHATLQDCLARVLEVRNAQIGTGLYFGLMDYQLNERFGRKTAYFMDLQQGLGFRFRMPDLYYLIEAMCAGSEGTASSFERSGEGNEVRPVLKSKENHAIIAWGLPKVHETIVSFADNLLLDPALISTDSDTREAVARVLEQFWFFPSATEAQTIVDFPFEGGMDGDVSRWVAARKYDWMHIGKSLIYGDFYRDSGVFWHEGSLALTSGFKKAALKGAARLGKCLRHPKSELHAFRDFCKTRIP